MSKRDDSPEAVARRFFTDNEVMFESDFVQHLRIRDRRALRQVRNVIRAGYRLAEVDGRTMRLVERAILGQRGKGGKA